MTRGAMQKARVADRELYRECDVDGKQRRGAENASQRHREERDTINAENIER